MNVDAKWSGAATWTALVAAVLCIYLPDVGHGFVQDDFAWILHARGDLFDVLDRAFTTSLGFFRPIVTLSFMLDAWMFGLEPFWYGLTNLLLAIAGMVGVEHLGRRLGLAPGYALLAAGVWVFNFHGINMGVLWISARTSLLATLFAVLAACAFERSAFAPRASAFALRASAFALRASADKRRPMRAAGWVMLALLSKEEAVLLPFVLAAWRFVDLVRETPPAFALRRALRDSWLLFVPLALYVALRSQSGAFTPLTAPEFYRFTTDPAHLTKNFVEYVYRSATTGALVLIVLLIATWTLARPASLARGLDRTQSAIVAKGLLWWLGGFAITMWLPVRSSLYAVLPSVGVALIVAACASALVSALGHERRRTLVVAGVLAPFLLLPVYRARNARWVSLGDLSAATLARVQADLQQLPSRTIVELVDDREPRANFAAAFGGLVPEASQLFLEREIELQIDAPPDPSRPRHRIRLADLNLR
jgi:hypothetical protein